MKQQVPIDICVEVFNLADGSDNTIYRDLLKQQAAGKLTITREEFVYDKLGTPKITVWYDRFEK